MKIGIDIQTTLGQKTGFGYYVENLVRELKLIDQKNSYSLMAPASEKDFSAPQRLFWDQWTLPKLALRNKVDLIHQPAFSVPINFPQPVVVTVHDLIAVRFGADIPFWSRQYFGRLMPFSYRYADHIIAASEHTKQDIIDLLNIPKEKISVIYLGLDYQLTKPVVRQEIDRVKNKFHIKDNYLLYIGTLNPRKNLIFLVNVFAKIASQLPNLSLVIVGKKGWYFEKLFSLIDKLGLTKRVILTNYVSDEDKVALYSGAEIFTFPSLYEGFGLPVLEAMALGVAVVASQRSSIPEIVGEAGVLLDPSSETEWVKSILEILKNQKLKNQYITLGRERAKQFSWRSTAKQTIGVYNQVIKINSKHQKKWNQL